jgi:hypothetical protein
MIYKEVGFYLFFYRLKGEFVSTKKTFKIKLGELTKKIKI